jgi:hypothetical protein
MHKQGDKRSFHSDKWKTEARNQVGTLPGMGRSNRSKERVRGYTIQVYVIVSGPYKNLHTVHHQQKRRTCLLRGTSDPINRQLC